MIKSQDTLNTCNDGKRKSDVLIATIEKCEKLEEKLKLAKEALENIVSDKGLYFYNSEKVSYAKKILKKIKE